MGSVINYVDAVIWFSALAAWGFFHEKIRAKIDETVARPMFNTDPEKTTRYLYSAVGCIFLFLAFSNLLAADRQHTFESMAENLKANQTDKNIRDPK